MYRLHVTDRMWKMAERSTLKSEERYATGRLDPKEVLARASEYGVDLSQLRERLRLSPTERIELHAGGARFVYDLREAAARHSDL